MSTLVRFNPFDDAFDNLFRGFLARPGYNGQSEPAPFRVDVTENDAAYTVRADIPGVKKEDIQITIEDNTVAISAEVKKQAEAREGDRVLRTERYYGKVQRAFALGQPVDEAAAIAKYADGVLELTLPKKPEAQAKRVTIQ